MTTNFAVDEYLSTRTDAQLREEYATCFEDLAQAANDEPNSEWHESCFAAFLLYSEEMQKRNLIIFKTAG